MKKIKSVILFLSYLIPLSYAQPLFINSVKHGDLKLDNWASSCVQYKNKYFILGTDQKFYPKDSTEIHTRSRFLMCTDNLGNKIWEKKDMKNASTGTIFVTDDNRLMIVQTYGYKTDSCFLLQINENGEVLKKQFFKTSENKYIRIDACIYTPENDIIIGAYRDTLDNFFDKFYGGSDYWLLRFKANGELVWKKNIGGIFNDIGQGIFKNPNNDGFNVVLSAYTLDLGQIVDKEAKVIKMDYNGNIIWNTKANTEQNIRFYGCNDVDKNGNTYLAYNKLINTTLATDMIFCKVNSKGKVEKEFKIPRELAGGGHNLGGLACDNNNVYISLTCSQCPYSKVELPNNVILKGASNILKFDKNLVPQWAYKVELLPKYDNTSIDINIPSAIIAKNGTITFLSNRPLEPALPPLSWQFDYWITIMQDLDVYSKECISEANLYPNPIHLSQSEITLAFSMGYYRDIVLRFFDNTGRIIDTKQMKVVGNTTSYSLPTSISSGMYFLQVQCDDKNSFTKKIVVTE